MISARTLREKGMCRKNLLDVVCIGAMLLYAGVSSVQGWRARPLYNPDLLPYYAGAYSMLHGGQVLERGQITSYGSYSTPGTVYLMIPGMILFRDPRLQDIPGALAVHAATLVFLYLVGRKLFDRPIAVGAVVGYGVSWWSPPSLWPIGQPAFVVATIYFLLRWGQDRRRWALPAAIVTTALGLYVYLAILPVIFLFPLFWLAYRPPVSARGLLLALGTAVLIWAPYLRFESGRGFQDLGSMLELRTVGGGAASTQSFPTYCNASMPGSSNTWEGTYIDLGFPEGGTKLYVDQGAGLVAHVRYRVCAVFTNLDRNFDASFFIWQANPVANVVLLTLAWIGIASMVALVANSIRRLTVLIHAFWATPPWTVVLGSLFGAVLLWGLMGALPTIYKLFIHSGLTDQWTAVIDQAQVFLPLLAASLALGAWLAQGLSDAGHGKANLGLSILVLWGIVVVMSEPNRAVRFWWLVPLEILAVMVGLVQVSKFIPRQRIVEPVLIGCAVLALVPSLRLERLADGWGREGFAGTDTGQIPVVDFIGAEAKEANRSELFVGYDISAIDYSRVFAATGDDLYRAGAWFDYLFLSRQGIRNLNRSVAGLDPRDEYRILGLKADQALPIDSPWLGFSPVARLGQYLVYKRR